MIADKRRVLDRPTHTVECTEQDTERSLLKSTIIGSKPPSPAIKQSRRPFADSLEGIENQLDVVIARINLHVQLEPKAE